ncbi:xanthine dehydrogenase family protein molybdopterin-binding subunit [Phreatobacter stygius]|uniref:Xanthine dehydrogenase family protein molybdopterin-binding subunit n=1 Tax=Phreatobacter stygius TaxID=1940610 RepID=A0A4D7B0G8_9HYPH|nr:molybdopterin cofactor-binding domain-containing protein [Phreatobacter stygius]QCI67139.1 xanthine dehydrogenase family protein molybdopterin-binding subunit [Phreatobacter stygius]
MPPGDLPPSLAANPRLDRWIRFADRNVVIATGKVELGQGVLTALAQIAAEELDVPLARITMVSGDTDQGPNEGYTAGSQSVEASGGAIRLVAAEARGLLAAAAASRLGADVADLAVEDGAFTRDGRPTNLDYWSLAEMIDWSRAATGAAPVKGPGDYRFVGQSLPRLDLEAKVTGAPFIQDIAEPGMVFGWVMRPPRRGATLEGFDPASLGRFGDTIAWHRDGNVLALTARSEHALGLARNILRAQAIWAGGEAVPDQAGSPDWLMGQVVSDRVIETGEPPVAAGEPIVATYSRPFLAHGSIGLSCGLARLDAGHLTVFSHSQGVFPLRGAIARALRLDPATVSVMHRQGAGCYGHNGADDAAADAAFLALRHPGRLVRVEWTRDDELGFSPVGAAMAVRLQASLDAEGRPAGWTTEIWSPPHAARPGTNGNVNLQLAEALPDPPAAAPAADIPDAAGGGGIRNAAIPYAVPGQRIIHHLITAQPVRASSLRTLGAFANVFAIECFLDELAEAAGRDPLAYRLELIGDPRARAVIQAAARTAGWRSDAEAGTGRAQGIGFSRYKNRAAYCAVVAEVEVGEEVRLSGIWSAVDAGLVINPDGVRNQIEGGILQGASWTLKEQVRFAEGAIASRTWDDYPILRFSEVPPVTVELLNVTADRPLGVGEASQGPVAAAIGNAVARALGSRIRHLPLSRERIMASLLAD